MIEGDVFDIETDGIYPTKIHCLSVYRSGRKIFSTTSYDNMRKFLLNSKAVIGHNIIRYDLRHMERILGVKYEGRVIDTLALSWYLEPNRQMHGLEWWGEEFGIPKPKIDDWENLTIEEYIHRCEEDVKINTKLWERFRKKLLSIYDDEEGALRLIDYLTFKLTCAKTQEELRWKLDVERAEKGLEELSADADARILALSKAMPKVPIMVTRNPPKAPYKRNGDLSVTGERWKEITDSLGLPFSYPHPVKVVNGFREPNPKSHSQIKDWLDSLGWVPQTFKYDRDKDTGEVRKIPQVNKPFGGGLCDSVKELMEIQPALEELEGLSVVNHRITILKGFLREADEDGYIQAKVQGLTNTLRFKHSVVVNLPGVNTPYGELIRGCLIAPEGYELVGSDMSSLEDRTKQHYMWPHDPEYVKEMMTPDFDPHLDLAQFAGELTPLQVAMHKAKEEDFSRTRDTYKGVNYAAVYGAGVATLARTAKCNESKAKDLLEAYWLRNWSVKKIAEEQFVKRVGGEMWLLNPVSKLYYSLRYEKDIFSTLNQGTGVWCFDTWVGQLVKKGVPLIGQMHDEVIGLIKVGYRDFVVKTFKDAIKETNEILKLNRELDVDVDFGDRYSEIH